MKQALCLLLCIFFIFKISAQVYQLTGVIKDAATGLPVENASVFLSNTSYGTNTSDKGIFTISNIAAGNYDLVVSSLGYASFSQQVSDKTAAHPLTISLQQKPKELDEVIVRTYDKNGWEKYGKFFTEIFIGTSAPSKKCMLKNPKDIKFTFSKKLNELRAYADEPLIIENKALGYVLKYQMVNFYFNYNTNQLLYAGYPYFREMDGSNGKKNKWRKARQEVYELSFTRFMRSLFRNHLTQDGYEIFSLEKIPNNERQRLQAKEKLYYDTVRKDKTVIGYKESLLNKDSVAYYDKIMAQKDPIVIVYPQKITGDSIAYAADKFTAALDFNNYLLVRIPQKAVPKEYVESNLGVSAKQPVSSELYLYDHKPVLITANGYYYGSDEFEDLQTSGFWGWWEKLSTLLPLDYSGN